jgi:guanylate kinase
MVMAPGKASAVVVSGPSGSGKTTLVKHLMLRYPQSHFSISATTRTLRGEEVDGVDYRFISREKFESLRNAGEMLEWAEVHGEFYGTPRKEVERALDQDLHVFLDIDVQGGLQVKEALGPRAWLLYVLPPDRETLETRLRGRGTEDEEKVALRLTNALGELAELPKYDAVVVNDDLARAVDEADQLMRSRQHNENEWFSSGGRELLKERFGLDLP